MKKILSLFALLASITASATVTVTPLSVDYSTQKVTFSVSWTGTAANNRVWVWVDLCPITGTTPGTFAKAVISGAAATAGSMDAATLNGRGFYVTTNPSTVTATLSNATGQFNWCAYGSDYPPNATMANGTYTLKGSPPFKITYNGSSNIETSDKSFTLGCMASITDATGCPGIINYPVFSVGALSNGSWGRMGEFLNVGGTPLTIVSATAASGGSGKITYKWFKNNAEIVGATAATYLPPKADAAAAGTFNYTRKDSDGFCNTVTASGTWTNVVGGPIHPLTGCSVYVALYDITLPMNYSDGVNACADLGTGWRIVNLTEALNCILPNWVTLGLVTTPPINYWIDHVGHPCSNHGNAPASEGLHIHMWWDGGAQWSHAYCAWGDKRQTFGVRCVRDK